MEADQPLGYLSSDLSSTPLGLAWELSYHLQQSKVMTVLGFAGKHSTLLLDSTEVSG